MSSLQLDPSVIDASTLQPKRSAPIFMPIGVEGQKLDVGSATVGTPITISRADESVTAFGAASPIHAIIKAVLDRSGGPVTAIASKSETTPSLSERQAAWEKLESDENIRLRLTDSTVQANLAALATSCKNANTLFNKQVAVVGMPSGTSKAALIAAATAIAAGGIDAASRAVLVGPGVYDPEGVLQSGAYAAACAAAEFAKNADPTNDLDLWTMPSLLAIEKGTDGLPVFRRKVVTGTPVNDFEDLQQGGVSVFQPARGGTGVQSTHFRTVYISDGTFDSIQTRFIDDQVFIDVKNYIYDNSFLRMGNTLSTRLRIQSGVEAVLAERNAWIRGVIQADGTVGYNVSVTSSDDERQVTIGYEGIINRGISTIRVAANLSIPV